MLSSRPLTYSYQMVLRLLVRRNVSHFSPRLLAPGINSLSNHRQFIRTVSKDATIGDDGNWKMAELKDSELKDADDYQGFGSTTTTTTIREIPYERQFEELIFSKSKQKPRIDGVRKALSLFDTMVKDGIDPSDYCYYCCITGCSRFGMVKESFELVDKLLQSRGDKWRPNEKLITILFTTCVESFGTDPKLGLEKAHFLRNYLQKINYSLNKPHYYVMVRTFRKLGDLNTVFDLVHEMRRNGQPVKGFIMIELLNGCTFEPETGFGHAIRVVRLMDKLNVPMELHMVNLILRCISSCGAGSREQLESIAKGWINDVRKIETEVVKPMIKRSYNKLDLSGYSDPSLNDDFDTDDSELINGTTSEVIVADSDIDSLIQTFLNYPANEPRSELIDLESLKLPENRLALLGGQEWVFDTIKLYGFRYTISTMTGLLQCLPDNNQVEEDLYRRCETLRIEMDIRFFNHILNRRSLRAVKERFNEQRFMDIDSVLREIQSRGLQVTVFTFSALAPSCNTTKRGMKLINDMKDVGLKPNFHVISPLIKNACGGNNVKYLRDLLGIMDEEKIDPDQEMINLIEETKSRIDVILFEQEKGLQPVLGIFNQPNYVYYYNDFKSFYKSWLNRHRVVDGNKIREEEIEEEVDMKIS